MIGPLLLFRQRGCAFVRLIYPSSATLNFDGREIRLLERAFSRPGFPSLGFRLVRLCFCLPEIPGISIILKPSNGFEQYKTLQNPLEVSVVPGSASKLSL